MQLTEDTEALPEYKSLLLDSYMAAALDELGQVDPVVWSMADIRFRKIAGDRGFGLRLESPVQSEIVNVSRAVGAEYTLVLWSVRSGTNVRPVASLYQGSGFRKIWTYGDWDRRLAPFFTGSIKPLGDSELREFQGQYGTEIKEFSAISIRNEPDWDSTSRTIARTFAYLLREGPFEKLPASPKQRLPEPDPGVTVPLPVGVTLPEQGGLIGVETLLNDGQMEMAIVQLRDLIDKNPFEDSFRMKLTEVLEGERLFVEAAREAIRGAQMSKKPAPFFHIGARNWLRAGIPDQARAALNNVLARGGENREVQMMMGQYYLRVGDYEQSITWYSKAIRSGPTPDIVYERAVAYGFAGRPDECRNDLASLVDVPALRLTESYLMMVDVSEEQFERIGVRLRDRIPLLRIHAKDGELISQTARDFQVATGLGALMELTPVPEEYKSSHGTRRLAHKLILQSTTEIFEYATTRKEDLATEGTMSLREAMKLLPQVRAMFDADRLGHRE